MNRWFTRSRVGAEDLNTKHTKSTKDETRAKRAIILCALRALRVESSLRLRVSACKINAVRTMLKLLVAFALMLPVAACGTKTELLMPNGKPTPHDQRDPSQPPSPISR
jgi:predicted small lipoprotein YifL